MDVFKGEGNDQLDTFFDQVEEFAAFFHWDERETCRQARAHLRGTALAYVKWVPFQPRSWDELKALLLKRFQPRDRTATRKLNSDLEGGGKQKISTPSWRHYRSWLTWLGRLWTIMPKKN